MDMNKQQLAAKIWASANDYKDYILGFIFYRYLSRREKTVLQEMILMTKRFPNMSKLYKNHKKKEFSNMRILFLWFSLFILMQCNSF